MELSIKQSALNDLAPYAQNARTHDENQIEQIVNSIETFGFTNPILIDEKKQIIAGHGRFEAATRLNLQTVPTITLANLTDAQKRAYVIADNQIALNAGWNLELLADELIALQDDDFSLDALGFSDDELADLLPGGVDHIGQDDDFIFKPQGENQEKKESLDLIVSCESIAAKEKTFKNLLAQGLRVKSK